MVSVEITIVTTETDPYVRYHGKAIDQSLDSSFWSTQPDKVFKTAGAGFTHTQTVELAEGSHYVIYGNSASASYPWHTKLFVNNTLIAEGDVVRGNHLRGNFTVTEAEPGWELDPPLYRGFEIWINIPDRNMYAVEIDGVWRYATLRSTIEALIDDYLGVEPVVTYLVISAPSSVEAGVTFEVLGYVLDQNGSPMEGVPVYLFDNGSHFATPTTGSNGYYFQNTSISLPGVHELAARADSKWAYKDITITEPPGVGIPTTTTISAPDKVGVDEKFMVSGILYETESGIPIPYQPINHSYNGRSLGGSTTGVDGDYLKEVSIPESGTWTLKSEFPGTETLQASRALADAVVAATPIATALLIAGPIATGLALFVYGTM